MRECFVIRSRQNQEGAQLCSYTNTTRFESGKLLGEPNAHQERKLEVARHLVFEHQLLENLAGASGMEMETRHRDDGLADARQGT